MSWFNRSQSGACYEHEADDEVKQTHVHLVLFGCEVQDEQLKRMFRLLCHLPGKGNGFWSFKNTYTKDNIDHPIDEGSITYMAKGTLRPKYVKLFSHEKLESLRLAWVEKVNSDNIPKDSIKFYVDRIVKHFDYVESLYDIPQGPEDKWGDRSSRQEVLFEMVRSKSFRVMFGIRGQAPHPPQYKIVASTVFMKLATRMDFEESATEVLIKSWY